MQYKFQKSALAIVISLLSQGIYAQSAHPTINFTEEIASKYTGKGVKLGVVDGGFILDHHNLDINKITPIKFELTTPAGGIERFDPKHDILEKESEEGEDEFEFDMISFHGGAVSAIINGVNTDLLPDSEDKEPFAGGVAPNAHLVVANIEPYEEDENFEADVTVVDLFGTDPTEIYDRKKSAVAIQKVAEQDVFAINNSWGMGGAEKFNDEKDAYYAEQAKSESTQSNELINAIKKAVKERNTLFSFATGNDGVANPDVMAMLPRYFPELEKNFLAVSAATKDGIEVYGNKCGYAKNWCITAPGNLFGLIAMYDRDSDKTIHTVESLEGTSYSTPVVTGSLGILKERFNYMTPTQVRDTLLTTAQDLGEKGVDDVYGWGLVDLTKAVEGPAQLLNDETYNVTTNDTWRNPIDSAQYKFTKTGESTLTLEGETKLKEIQVDEGRLNLHNSTTTPILRNHAELGLATTLSSQIFASDQSTTHFSPNAHWKMPQSSTLGNVQMEDGSQITLNPNHSKANGDPNSVSQFNTLTIYNNLSGKGQFNFVSRLENNQSDKVVVKGVANGQFKLQVENTGAEPSSPQQLDLVQVANPEQSEVSFTLANNVDLGAYRYVLAKSSENNRYYLYNPKKEQELEDQRQAELISRYSNTALSDLSAQTNALLNVGKIRTQKLFDKVDNLTVWTNIEGSKDKRSSENYRAYQQNSHLTQIGVQKALNENVDVGVVVSQSKSSIDFDREGKGKSTLYSADVFAKGVFNQFVAQAELGLGKAKNRVNVDNDSAEFNRRHTTAGIQFGYNWDLAGLQIQPNVGVGYHRLSAAHYQVNNAKVKTDAFNLFTYQAGVKVGKTFNIGNIELTPSLTSYYEATSAKDNVVSVNDRQLSQAYGNQFQHEFALGSKWQNWEASAKFGFKTGNESHRQHYWGVNIGYNW